MSDHKKESHGSACRSVGFDSWGSFVDVRDFCGGYSTLLAMRGAALDRYLPGRNAMLVNEFMYDSIIQ